MTFWTKTFGPTFFAPNVCYVRLLDHRVIPGSLWVTWRFWIRSPPRVERCRREARREKCTHGNFTLPTIHQCIAMINEYMDKSIGKPFHLAKFISFSTRQSLHDLRIRGICFNSKWYSTKSILKLWFKGSLTLLMIDIFLCWPDLACVTWGLNDVPILKSVSIVQSHSQSDRLFR